MEYNNGLTFFVSMKVMNWVQDKGLLIKRATGLLYSKHFHENTRQVSSGVNHVIGLEDKQITGAAIEIAEENIR